MDEPMCTKEWINKCDAHSLILTHISTIICRSFVSCTNETQRDWDGPGSPTDQNPVEFWGWHGRAGEGSTELPLPSLTLVAKGLWPVFPHLQNSPAVAMLLLLWEGSVLNPYFCHLIWKSKISRRTEKCWVSKHSTYRKEGHQDLAFSKRSVNVDCLLVDLEWFPS